MVGVYNTSIFNNKDPIYQKLYVKEESRERFYINSVGKPGGGPVRPQLNIVFGNCPKH